ncbi:MAG: PEP-CTERM sorting domain-containing protein [Pseudomonadota bacterium]|nr:PEP-CTERM sorting domain-containing protein [Pseudomonadota bacterium]
MFKRLLLATVLTASALAGVSQAQAAPIIQLMVGSTVITDNGAGDNSPINDVISYSAAVAPFNVTVNTGVANDLPYLDLASQDISSSAAGTLIIKFTATDLTSPSAITNYLTMFSGNIAGGSATVRLQSYYDASNSAFGTATALGNLSSSNAGFFLNSVNAAGGSAMFSLTEILTVTADGAGRNFSLDASVSNVPEPMSIALVGTGLVGIGALRRKRTA